MAHSRRSTLLAVVVYTVLRVALFALVWLTIELITPISGIWAIVAALLISGAISIVVLDRPRGRVGAATAGFFGRINARIDAATRAEDDALDALDSRPEGVAAESEPAASDEGEQPAERDAVDK